MSNFVTYAFKITIYPILTNVNKLSELASGTSPSQIDVSSGNYLNIDGNDVDNIEILINGDGQNTILSYLNKKVQLPFNIYVLNFTVSNHVFNGNNFASLDLVLNNNSGYNTFSDPIIDLFRASDLIKIELQDPITGAITPLFKGSITSDLIVKYNVEGVNINISIESYINLLARTAVVQVQQDQYNGAITSSNFIDPLVTKQLQLGLFLERIMNETTIVLGNQEINFWAGVTNNIQEDIGKQETMTDDYLNKYNISTGTALNQSTILYIPTSATTSKLTAINQVLYPYHKVFYCDNNGDFHITPLQNYFDTNNAWNFYIEDPIPNGINASEVIVRTNTATIYNRDIVTLISLFAQFNQTNATGVNDKTFNNIICLSTMQNKEYFPRLTELFQSTKCFNTNISTQELNQNIVQNPGLFNMINTLINTSGDGVIKGLKTIYDISSNSSQLNSNNQQGDRLKNFISLYSSRSLAESLFNDKLVDITFDMNLAYIDNKGFRNIPLNQMVNIPTTKNNVFDGLQSMYCYGYSATFNISVGFVCTLHLCKPYTYTAFWCDSINNIDKIDVAPNYFPK